MSLVILMLACAGAPEPTPEPTPEPAAEAPAAPPASAPAATAADTETCSVSGAKFAGTLNTSQYPPSGKPVTADFRADGTGTWDAQISKYDATWKMEGEELVVTDVSSDPRHTCTPDLLGRYRIEWSDACKTAKLVAVSDQCPGRQVHIDGMALTRQ